MSVHLFPPVFPALGAIAAATLRDAGFDAFVEASPAGSVVTVRLHRPDATATEVDQVATDECVVTKVSAGFVLQSQPVSCESSAIRLSRFMRHVLASSAAPIEPLTA